MVLPARGTKLKFTVPGLVERFGHGPFTVEAVDPMSRGVQLQELPGKSFDLADMVDPEEEPEVAIDAVRPVPCMEHDMALQLIERLRDALPMAVRVGDETGFREESFYRFPTTGMCFCGKPLRRTLDGWRCEDNHFANVP